LKNIPHLIGEYSQKIDLAGAAKATEPAVPGEIRLGIHVASEAAAG
jgi:hypothetical protein